MITYYIEYWKWRHGHFTFFIDRMVRRQLTLRIADFKHYQLSLVVFQTNVIT